MPHSAARSFTEERYYRLPQKTTGNQKKSNKPDYYSDVRFIDLALDKSQEEAMKKSKFAETKYPAVLDELLADGMKVTFKTDARNASIMLMVQNAVYDPDETTVIWVMRSGSAAGALLKMAYYWSISDGTLPENIEPNKDDLSDDWLFA